MYVLSYKIAHIVPGPMRKNRTCQSYRWKQYAMCANKQPLQAFVDRQIDKTEWRIEKHGEREETENEP